jgi:hypothetical protein
MACSKSAIENSTFYSDKVISFGGYEEMKECKFRLTDFTQIEDKENISWYSNMPAGEKENVLTTSAHKLNLIQSIPISSKSRYVDENISAQLLEQRKKKREIKRMPLQEMREYSGQESHEIDSPCII